VTETPANAKRQVNWLTAIVLFLLHAGALAAPFFFTWGALITAAAMYWVCISWGIGMGYHRLLTHRGYRIWKPLEYFLAICGTMTLEGGPIFWVGTHRIHHQLSDREGDPHSPNDGAFWSHMGWLLYGPSLHNNTQLMSKYAPDMAREPFYRLLNKWHWVPLTLSGIVLLAAGGWSYLLWAGCVRVVIGLHSTWLVNSATHIWGSRRFLTRDNSRNNWWVALMTFGEGWHNNHHAHPASSRHGLTWYELDLTWIQIRVLKFLGIVRNVQVAKWRHEEQPQEEAA